MSENDGTPATLNSLADHGETVIEIQHGMDDRLRSCPYAFQFNRVQWQFTSGTLTLSGSVATLHLKQVLQTMLRDLNYVQQIVNEVDVVSATGLSSERTLANRRT
jgi:hypothetical protein